MNPVAILRHSGAATLALGLCMWAQIPHSKHVFEHWAKDQSGIAFAWGFEAAVLMFVVRNMHGASWTFASLSAFINVGYYEMQGVHMWAWPNQDNWLCWLLSLALPFTIAMYSHVLADANETPIKMPAKLQFVVVWLRTQVATLPFAQVLQGESRDRMIDIGLNDFAPQLADSPSFDFAQVENKPPVELEIVAHEQGKAAEPQVQKPQIQGANVALADLRKKAQRMRNQGKTLEDIAAQVGRSATWVSRNTESVAA